MASETASASGAMRSQHGSSADGTGSSGSAVSANKERLLVGFDCRKLRKKLESTTCSGSDRKTRIPSVRFTKPIDQDFARVDAGRMLTADFVTALLDVGLRDCDTMNILEGSHSIYVPSVNSGFQGVVCMLTTNELARMGDVKGDGGWDHLVVPAAELRAAKKVAATAQLPLYVLSCFFGQRAQHFIASILNLSSGCILLYDSMKEADYTAQLMEQSAAELVVTVQSWLRSEKIEFESYMV